MLEQDSNVKNVIIWKSYLENENYNSLVLIYIWAVEHGMTVNYFYLARDDAQLYELRTEKALKDKISLSLKLLMNHYVYKKACTIKL